jgi:hypothetical protein
MFVNQFKKYFLVFILNVYLILDSFNTSLNNIVKGLMWNTITKVTEYDTDNNTFRVKYNILNPFHWIMDPYEYTREYCIYETEKGFNTYNISSGYVNFRHIFLIGDDMIYATFEYESTDVSSFINKYKGCLSSFTFHEIIWIMYMQSIITIDQYENILHRDRVTMMFMTHANDFEKTFKGEDYFRI